LKILDIWIMSLVFLRRRGRDAHTYYLAHRVRDTMPGSTKVSDNTSTFVGPPMLGEAQFCVPSNKRYQIMRNAFTIHSKKEKKTLRPLPIRRWKFHRHKATERVPGRFDCILVSLRRRLGLLPQRNRERFRMLTLPRIYLRTKTGQRNKEREKGKTTRKDRAGLQEAPNSHASKQNHLKPAKSKNPK
jgi:hypothetical protein